MTTLEKAASGHDAEPEDLYVDKAGAVWRVVGVWNQPTVLLELVEDKTQRQHLGVDGQTWFDLTRVWRRPPKPPVERDPYAYSKAGMPVWGT